MPVFMIGFLALVTFILVGVLLTAAVLCEPKKAKDSDRPKPAAASHGRPA